MAKHSNQKLKVLYVLDILKKHSDEEHPLNAADIVRLLENAGISAERKSVYDDIFALELYGCDIIKTDTPKIGWFIGEREFEVPEIYLLCDAVRSAKFISAKKTRELISKLSSMLSNYQIKRRESGIFFSHGEKSGNEEIYYSIDKISLAIEEGRQIKIKYLQRKFDKSGSIKGDNKEMVLNPYALCWQDDHYYLIGNHPKYDNLIHLRLDRIRSTEILDAPARHFSEVSEYTDRFNTDDYVSRLFGMHTGVKQSVELWCSNAVTEQILDRFTENIFVTHTDEAGFKFKTDLIISDALVTFIINYGSDIKVIKPEALVQMVTKRAETVLENYTK